jgi:putative ABC transport system permease protein
MKALDHKMLRDLWKMKGQVVAIVLVIVSGVSTFTMFISTMNSLSVTRERCYEDYDFAEVFASLKRAPEGLKDRIREIPGVDQVETRVVADVKLKIEGFTEPVTAKIVSVPDSGSSLLNKLYLRKGRRVDPWKENEVIVSETFAEAHGFKLGDTFGAIINGKWKKLTMVGIALSPEFVIQVRPGAITPDYERYAILWMGRRALATAYDMEGAFNDVALSLYADAKLDNILTQLDELLKKYGGLGSYGRKDQLSHRYLTEEFRQLETSATIYPAIFIAVSAFLLNVVISRTINTQREQIAILKAFGYSNVNVGVHYIKLVMVVVLAGIAGGLAVGAWLGSKLGGIYMEFYRFPYLIYELQPSVAITVTLIVILSALAGTLFSIRKASKLPPAEAMRPEPPARYQKSFIESFGFWRFFSQPTKIILRNIERRPVKSLLSITGIAFACAIMIAGTFFTDAVDFMVDVQFRLSQKEDMTITFIDPTSTKALFGLKRMKGIFHAEPFRTVPVRLRFQHRSYRTSIQGIIPEGHLHFLLNTDLKPVSPPPNGIVLTDYLGNLLGIKPGNLLTVEVLEGSRPVRQISVVGLIPQYIGLNAYMDLAGLNRLMREGRAISGAYLMTDSFYEREIYEKLIEMPRVAGTVVRGDEIRNFYDTMAEFLLFFTFVASLFAGVIAFGVVYNSARIALAERSRELASLRVLGYTRAEISYIFLGELGLFTLTAIPLGFFIGRGICIYIARAVESDLFRIPVIVEPGTYSLAAAVVVMSAFLSGLIVRHRLDHLDLIAVLKTKE